MRNLHKSRKRRHGGKLKRLSMPDRYRKREHWERTGREAKIFAKRKVMPGAKED